MSGASDFELAAASELQAEIGEVVGGADGVVDRVAAVGRGDQKPVGDRSAPVGTGIEPVEPVHDAEEAADIAGVELIVAEVAESSARGAAMAAMLGLGAVSSFADLSRLRGNVRSYRPTMDRTKADQLYSGWRQAVQRVL